MIFLKYIKEAQLKISEQLSAVVVKGLRKLLNLRVLSTQGVLSNVPYHAKGS
jgi:hypothetical protein